GQQAEGFSLFADTSEVLDHWVRSRGEMPSIEPNSEIIIKDEDALQVNRFNKRESNQAVKGGHKRFRRDYSLSRSVSDSGPSTDYTKAHEASFFGKRKSKQAVKEEYTGFREDCSPPRGESDSDLLKEKEEATGEYDSALPTEEKKDIKNSPFQ
ncbi:hypothetical protein PoB_004500700, partial [Plakobranchus ocellatus]